MYFSPLNYANEKGIKLSNDVNSELTKAYRKKPCEPVLAQGFISSS